MTGFSLTLYCFCRLLSVLKIYMGVVSTLNIAFASFTLFAALLQIFVSYRKQRDLLTLSCAVLSCLAFVHFCLMILCDAPFGLSCPLFLLLKYQVVISQVVEIMMLVILYLIIRPPNKIFVFLTCLVIFIFMIMVMVIPDPVLFGDNATVRYAEIPVTEKVLMIGTDFTVWRIFKDLTAVIFISVSFIFLFKKSDRINTRTRSVLLTGLGITLLSAIYDQFVDLGLFHTVYIFPFAFFIYYLILTNIPFFGIINESIKRNRADNQQDNLQHLLNHGDFIFIQLDRMGIVEKVNPYFYALTGYHEEEVIGKDWFEFFIPKKDFYKLQGAFVEVLDSEFHPLYMNPVLTKNKGEIMIRWVNVRTADRSGKTKGSLSIGIDITDIIRDNEKIQAKLKEAEMLIARLTSKPGQD